MKVQRLGRCPEINAEATERSCVMTILSIGLTAAIRVVLVLLFLPFSALDKILNFRGAVAQAREVAPSATVAIGLICIGLFVEIFMSVGVITGIADPNPMLTKKSHGFAMPFSGPRSRTENTAIVASRIPCVPRAGESTINESRA